VKTFFRLFSRVVWFCFRRHRRFEDHLCIHPQGEERDGLRNVGVYERWSSKCRCLRKQNHTARLKTRKNFFTRMVKVKLSLCFNWAPRHEGVLGSGGIAPPILWLPALYGGKWSASRPGRLTPRGTHWIGGWVGPRAVLDAVVKRKIPSRRRESNPKHQSSSP
jgi:hypothetical protein